MNPLTQKLAALTLLLTFTSTTSATQTQQWTAQLGTNNFEFATAISTDHIGNIYITGYTGGSLSGANAGNTDAFIAKYDQIGNLKWTKQLGTNQFEFSNAISADKLGNVYISGSTDGSLSGTNQGGDDAFITKYDQYGNLTWTKQLGTNARDDSTAISADKLGNIFITGYTSGNLEGTNLGNTDAFITKYDSSGNINWTKQFGTNNFDESFAASADGLGNVYITGTTEGNLNAANAGGADAFIAKYDTNGNLSWTKQFGTTEQDNATGISADGLGNIYITGSTTGDLNGTNAGDSDAFITKYDANGNLHWTRQLGTVAQDNSQAISADGLGNVYISGYTHGDLDGPNAGAFSDPFITKYDNQGNITWTKQFGTNTSDDSFGVSADGRGNVYITGTTFGKLGQINTGEGDAFITKFSGPLGDLNGDNLIDQADLDILKQHFGTDSFLGDTAQDGNTNLADLFVIRNNFNPEINDTQKTSPNTIPEPTAILLITLPLLAITKRKTTN